MSEDPRPLHDRLLEALRLASPEASALARERMEELMPVGQQMEGIVRDGEASPEFLQGAERALQAVRAYMQVLTTPARSIDCLVEDLSQAQLEMMAAQEELAQAHHRALELLPLRMKRVPHNLQQLRYLLLGWMQGLVTRAQVEEVFRTLHEIYSAAWQQLADADSISSKWEPEHQQHLGSIMVKLDEGYRTGTESLEMLDQVVNAAGSAALWPLMVRSFELVQVAADDIEELEESVGSLNVLEGLTAFAGQEGQKGLRQWLV